MYGNPEITSGGNALKYYASVRIDVAPLPRPFLSYRSPSHSPLAKTKVRVDIRKKETIAGEKGEVVGIKVRAKVVKNKVAVPYREANFDIRFGHGIDELGALFEAAEQCGVVSRRGSYYYYGEEKLSQGKENALVKIRESEALQLQLREAIRLKLAAGEIDLTASADEEAEDDAVLGGAAFEPTGAE